MSERGRFEMKVGSSGTVFGRPVTVVAISRNGKRTLVAGGFNGWTTASNVKVTS